MPFDINEFIEENKTILIVSGIVVGGLVVYHFVKKPKTDWTAPPPLPPGGGGGTTPPTPPQPTGKVVVLNPEHPHIAGDVGDYYDYWPIPFKTWPFYGSYSRLYEVDLNLQFALLTGLYLMNSGIEVIFTRTSKAPISVADRVRIACDTKPNAFISIRVPRDSASGTLGIFCNDNSMTMAQKITNAVSQAAGRGNRGITKRCSESVLNHTCGFPSVIIQVASINDWYFANKYLLADIKGTSPYTKGEYIQDICKALAKGIIESI